MQSWHVRVKAYLEGDKEGRSAYARRGLFDNQLRGRGAGVAFVLEQVNTGGQR